MPVHANVTGTEIHVFHFKTYATHALRLADTTLVAADIGKIVRVSADNSYWVVLSATPTFRRVDAHQHEIIIDMSSGFTVAASPVDLGFRLPDNATIVRAWYEVVTTIASATTAATLGLGVATDDATGIKAAIVISDASWAAGYQDAVPDGTAANFTTKSTAIRAIQATVAVEDITAGKVYLWIEYIDSE